MTDRLGKITRCYTIRYDRHSKHSPSRLWAAITRADEVSAWMDYPAKIDLRVGGEWHVDFGRTGDGELGELPTLAVPLGDLNVSGPSARAALVARF